MAIHRLHDAYVADSARVLGQVTLGRDVNVWYGVVIRGDVAPIAIGDNTNVQDNAVIHCDSEYPSVIEANVTVGHGAVIHGEHIGEGTMVGMHATVLGHTRIGRRCLIAAGAVVPPGLEAPDDSVVMGVPGRIVRPTSEKEREYLRWVPGHYVKLARRHHEHPDDPRVRPLGPL